MRSSGVFPHQCPERPSLSSSRSRSENDAAVKPISALSLLRIAINRRNRTEEEEEEEVVVNHNRNNDNDINSNILLSSLPSSLSSSSSSSSSFIYLLRNPFFSLPLGITEIAGPAGVGKTQIALSLCADCVLQHHNHNHHQNHNDENNNNNNNNNDMKKKKKKAVYIQLGGSSKFLQTASRRLQSMIQSRTVTTTPTTENNGDTNNNYNHQHQQQQDDDNDGIVHDCLTRVLVRWICNSDELMDLLTTNLDRLLHQNPTISLVILDGIANLFRFLPEYEPQSSSQQQQSSQHYNNNNPWHHRAITFFQISNLCKELSTKYEVPFVIINECTTKIPNDTITTSTDTGGTTFHRNYQQKQLPVLEPALGLAWSQCVNCRFFVRRLGVMTTTYNNSNNSSDHQQQQLQESSSSTATTAAMPTSTTNSGNSNNNKAYGRRLLHCLKAPHISSERAKLEFTIDRSGVIPI